MSFSPIYNGDGLPTIPYDPAKVKLDQLFEVFFTIAHDPTQLNRQGGDNASAASLGHAPGHNVGDVRARHDDERQRQHDVGQTRSEHRHEREERDVEAHTDDSNGRS